MRIVHVMMWYIPGMGYQENFLPAEQKKLGHDVYIIASDRTPPYVGFDNNVGKILSNRFVGTAESLENDVKIYRLRTLFEMTSGGVVVFYGLKDLLYQLKPDVVHAHGPYCYSTLLSVFWSGILGYKVVIDDHSNYQNFRIDSPIKRISLNLITTFYMYFGKKVKKWLPVEEPAKRLLKENLNLKDSDIQIIPMGVNSDLFYQSQQTREWMRRELSVEGNEILIITSGKFNKSKDIDILIMAIKELRDLHGRIKLLILGGGPKEYMEYLKDIANADGKDCLVIFKDFVKNHELPLYYNAADIGVWPGTHTITAVEALGTGLPVILPMDDLSYSIIFQNNAAFGFERKNVSSLAQIIRNIIECPGLRMAIKKNALSLVRDQLCWRKIAQDYINTYQN